MKSIDDKAISYWNDIHKSYERDQIVYDDWLVKFDNIIMACKKPILDLGCGSGNDTKYLIDKGKAVISCDRSLNAIQNIIKNFPEVVDTKVFDMAEAMPFEDNSFEVVIADLSIHYFKENVTKAILDNIRRILVPGGHFILRVNSINDINHGAGQGEEIEHHLYQNVKSGLKRFFDDEDIKKFFQDFEIIYMREEDMTRYSMLKKAYTICVRK
ncbi:MAG: class I SAM-dependent methyltransferase [Eubacterium sp.]|nr:class I SAM-dependent methyltransferase [Eubacterium sp.]